MAASWMTQLGARVSDFKGQYWVANGRGLWSPVDELAVLDRASIGWPSSRALAYRAVVGDPADSNAWVPFELVPDLSSYSEKRLTKNRRREIRRSLEVDEYRVMTDPELLLRDGWEVVSGAATISGQKIAKSKYAYRKGIERRFATDPQLVIAGVHQGELGGYILAHAIGHHASLTEIYVAPWARRSHLGSGLYWLALSELAKVSGLEAAYLGMWFPEKPTLGFFKRSLGARIVDRPTYGKMRAPFGLALQRLRPNTYIRFGGADPRVRSKVGVTVDFGTT
jgi:acetyltransferase (GNAT) family protein